MVWHIAWAAWSLSREALFSQVNPTGQPVFDFARHVNIWKPAPLWTHGQNDTRQTGVAVCPLQPACGVALTAPPAPACTPKPVQVEARRRHGHYWEHHHHHRHHQAAEPGQASAAHRLANAAAGVAREAVAPAATHSRSAADRQRQLLRRLSSAAAALTGTQDGRAAEGGPLPAAAKPLLVGLAAVALMQSRLLGALAAAGVVVLVAAMLLGLLLVELARAIGGGLTGAVRWLSDPQASQECHSWGSAQELLTFHAFAFCGHTAEWWLACLRKQSCQP